MTMTTNAVTVKRFPEILGAGKGQTFLRELSPYLTVNHPCLVIDCSLLRKPDTAMLHLLLCCLEEAMKHNGDVRLAVVSPDAGAILKSTGIDRLFRIFDSIADAETSFNRSRADVVLRESSHFASDEVRQ